LLRQVSDTAVRVETAVDFHIVSHDEALITDRIISDRRKNFLRTLAVDGSVQFRSRILPSASVAFARSGFFDIHDAVAVRHKIYLVCAQVYFHTEKTLPACRIFGT